MPNIIGRIDFFGFSESTNIDIPKLLFFGFSTNPTDKMAYLQFWGFSEDELPEDRKYAKLIYQIM